MHVEVEKKAKTGFGRRMFRYFSRLFDKHDIPVISIAVFLEKRTEHNKPVFDYSLCGTTVKYTFNTLYVGELDDIKLSRSDNPFAKILLITKLAIRKNIPIQDVFEQKKALARQLFNLDLPATQSRQLINFLKAYVHFDDKEINNKFEEEIKVLTNKKETMGIEEMIIDMAEKRGIEKGISSTIKEVAGNMTKRGLDLQLIHETTSLSLTKLKKLKRELALDSSLPAI